MVLPQTSSQRLQARHGYLSEEPGALEIFGRSFRENFPKVCEGRKVIICDCSIIKDPCDHKYLRNHTGRHFENVERLVDHEDFVGLNMSMQDIDDQQVLIIDACVHGRHRSVANKEVQAELFFDRRHNTQRGNIHLLDLQAGRQWTHLCNRDCPECNCSSQRFKMLMKKGNDCSEGFVQRREWLHLQEQDINLSVCSSRK